MDFTGHLRCPFTGLTLARYRVLGYANWLSRDPIGEAGGVNLYSYAINNPAKYIYPTGEIAFVLVVLAVRAAAEVALADSVLKVQQKEEVMVSSWDAHNSLAAWDTYDIALAVADPCKSLRQKVLAGGLFLAGTALPGGGYSHLNDFADAAAKSADTIAEGLRISRYRATAPGETFIRYESANPAFARIPSGGVAGNFRCSGKRRIRSTRRPFCSLQPTGSGNPVIACNYINTSARYINCRPTSVVGGTGNEVVFPIGY